MNDKGKLIFFTGKMAVGKTTYSKKLASELNAIYVSEDQWLSYLYPDEINDFNDYIKYSSRIKPLLEEHLTQLLLSGLTVVMDFPGNTIKQRQWFKTLFRKSKIPHKLIYLRAEDDLCLRHLEKRWEESPERQKFDTLEVFKYVNGFFQEPTDKEGFNIEIIDV